MQISDERRGKVGRWLRSQRLAHRYETQKAILAALEAGGWSVPASVYSEWESGGRVPSSENMARLREFFGAPEPSDDQADLMRILIAATNRQADALEALVGRLDELAANQTRLAYLVGDIAGQAQAALDREGSQTETPPQHRRRGSRGSRPGSARPSWEEEANGSESRVAQ